jgi:SAM-dependent methyltransferase
MKLMMDLTENNSVPNGSKRYYGGGGKAYFMYQNIGGMQRGRINARKFVKDVKASDVVLDFGCGSGALLLNLNCRKRIGVEINPIARKEAEEHGLEVHESLSTIPDQCVDVVISNHSLEHVLCPLQSLQELRRKLVRGGRLVLCVPIDDWRTQKIVNLDDINHHLHTWTPLLLGNLLSEAGYQIERVWIYTHAWPPKHWQKLDANLPVWLFDLICWFTAIRYKRRQIMAVAYNP